MAVTNFAVLFKTHAWDEFIARQYTRYCDAVGRDRVFVFLDETAGPITGAPLKNVLRGTNDDLFAIGLGRRYERGSLLWWNTDYPHYLFAARHPGFDYTLCVEYDTCCLGDVAAFVEAAAAQGADLVTLPTRTPLDQWMWTRFHLQTYERAVLAGSLNCISLISARAMALLARRRVEMADEARNGRVAFWPGNEVFIATEIGRAGYKMIPLNTFGDTSRYEWHPPILEDDLPASGGMMFLHPVLDRRRYIASTLKFAESPLSYYNKWSALRRDLSRFPEREWRPQLGKAAWARTRMRLRERAEGVWARFGLLAQRG
jgi:hypothetical protein